MTRTLVSTLAGALAAALAAASPAWAKDGVGGDSPAFGEQPKPHYESPQWFAFELKFGPYSPDIDSSAGVHGTPFADLFNPQGTKGRPPGRLLTSLEFDFQFLHKFGSLAIGHSIGYYRRTTHSFQYPTGADGMPLKDGNGNVIACQVPHCIRSGDETGLNILPLELMLVYRFDVLALRYKVPIVPYVKLGLAYYIWWIENGEGFGSTASFTDNKGHTQDGYGGTFGWVANPGVSILLDVLDPSAARTVDAELGINHSYVFFEMHYADVSGFGASNKLTLSDLTWNTGLAFEF